MGNISSRTWFDLLVEIEKDYPDRPCLIFKDGKHTYSEIHQRSQALGESLKERGVKPGDRVGIWAPNQCEWLEVLFATSYLGVAIVPFSTLSTKSELSFLIDDSKVNWVFSVSNHYMISHFSHMVISNLYIFMWILSSYHNFLNIFNKIFYSSLLYPIFIFTITINSF